MRPYIISAKEVDDIKEHASEGPRWVPHSDNIFVLAFLYDFRDTEKRIVDDTMSTFNL
ncbi:hypothetical protein GW17_00000998 [Ensete ventricosum]|nr:hypothetical protein GW17_00000998 [Ensete ventricosum]